MSTLSDFLAACSIDADVAALRPDYRVLLIAVDGLTPGESDEHSEQLIAGAEAWAVEQLAERKAEEMPHIAAWREAYRAFGAKPQRTRVSLEALMRRAPNGFPRVNRLTDIYNAISVRHQVPLGGEDLDHYVGPARLAVATGEEDFLTSADGEPVTEHPEAGEVIWRDDAGVTCRRWNWRQTSRTGLSEETTRALFILDALDPMTDAELTAAGDELVAELRALGPAVDVATRIMRASGV